MKFLINETKEHKTLSIIDQNGVDWTDDLIGNTGAIGDYIQYDEDEEAYRISQGDFDWWEEYINNAEADEEELMELLKDYDGEYVYTIIDDYLDSDNYELHHLQMQAAFTAIKKGAMKK